MACACRKRAASGERSCESAAAPGRGRSNAWRGLATAALLTSSTVESRTIALCIAICSPVTAADTRAWSRSATTIRQAASWMGFYLRSWPRPEGRPCAAASRAFLSGLSSARAVPIAAVPAASTAAAAAFLATRFNFEPVPESAGVLDFAAFLARGLLIFARAAGFEGALDLPRFAGFFMVPPGELVCARTWPQHSASPRLRWQARRVSDPLLLRKRQADRRARGSRFEPAAPALPAQKQQPNPPSQGANRQPQEGRLIRYMAGKSAPVLHDHA